MCLSKLPTERDSFPMAIAILVREQISRGAFRRIILMNPCQKYRGEMCQFAMIAVPSVNLSFLRQNFSRVYLWWAFAITKLLRSAGPNIYNQNNRTKYFAGPNIYNQNNRTILFYRRPWQHSLGTREIPPLAAIFACSKWL